jgi:threonine dehydrogenase-like Zn-dependent dehydrogenase
MEQQVLVFRGPGDAVFETRSVPDLKQDEFRVEATHSLVSPGTELALYRKTHIGFDDPEITWCAYPLDIGYASAGIVSESRNPAVSEGDRVVHYGPHANVVTIGPGGPVWAPIPEGVIPPVACFGRFAQIAYSAVAAAVRSPRRVLVYGAGIVGNVTAQWFQDLGADVVLADVSALRLGIAARCGVSQTETVVADPENARAVPDTVRGFDGDPPDTVVEATGVASVVTEALNRVAVGGQVVLLGSIRHAVTINAYKQIHRKAVILSGAHETILGDDRSSVLSQSLEALAEHRLKVDPIITKSIAASGLPTVYERIIEDPDTYFGVIANWGAK